MSEVVRNEQDKILDEHGHVVEDEAAYKQTKVNYLTGEAERAREDAEETLRTKGSAAIESYKAVEAQRLAETNRDAAEWKNFKYYSENRQGYEEAAQAEDERRTSEKAEQVSSDQPSNH